MGSISPVNPKVGKKQTHTKELFFPFQPQHYWNNDNQSPYKDKYIAERNQIMIMRMVIIP